MEKQQTILFLSHTQIANDSRILKAMNVARNMKNVTVRGIGIQSRVNYIMAPTELMITDIKLLTRSLIFLPAVIRHSLSLLEFYIHCLLLIRSQKISAVYCNDDTSLPIAVFIKFLKKTKLIYDAHELECDRNGISRLHGRIVSFIEKFLWHYINHFITVSPSILDWYLSEYGEKKSTVIYNAPAQKPSSNQLTSSFHDIFNLRDDQKVFLYLGKLMPGRGLLDIIDNFSRLDDKYCFVMLGDGHLKPKLIERVNETRCNNIFFHDPVPHDEVVNLARSANYGLCLLENVSKSDYLALPNKLFEYTFAGLPIIASDFPEIKKFLNNAKFGIVLSDINELSAVIEGPILNKKFALNRVYMAQFKWSAQIEVLCGVFEDILKED